MSSIKHASSMLNYTLAISLPCVAISTIYTMYYYYKHKQQHKKKIHLSQPISIIVDVGSSSIRCIAYLYNDKHWEMIPSSCHSIEGNSLKFPLSTIFDHVNQCMDQIILFLRKNNYISSSLSSRHVFIGITGFVMNLMGFDAKHNVKTPIFTYVEPKDDDSRLHYFNELKIKLSQKENLSQLYQQTGVPYHSTYAPAQLYCYFKENPLVQNEIAYFHTISQYIISQWTKNFQLPIHCSEASWTGLMNVHSICWSTNLLKELNLSTLQFPNITSSPFYVEHFDSIYQKRWPELIQAKIFLGIGDGMAANIGLNCVHASRVALTIGTSAAVRTILPVASVPRIPKGCFCYRISKEYMLLGGALTDGGSFFKWFQQNFQHDQNVLQKAAKMLPDEHNLIILPFLNGERSPGYQLQAKGTIHGITLQTTSSHVLRAFYEAIAIRLATIYSLFAEFLSSDVILIGNGKALKQSKLWRQIVADAMGVDLFMHENEEESSSLGVACYIGQEILNYSFDQMIPLNLSSMDYMSSHPPAHNIYQQAKSKQLKIYDKILCNTLFDV